VARRGASGRLLCAPQREGVNGAPEGRFLACGRDPCGSWFGASGWVVPPVLAVGLYFCLWHATRLIVRLSPLNGSPAVALGTGRLSPDSGSRETPRPSPALPLLVGLFFGVPASMEGPGPLIALYLVLVSSLTLPHAAVVSYMDLRPELSLPEGPLQLLARRRRSRREEETFEVGLPGGGWGKK
jgi:beta-carotene 15,15'-dioxygenase